MKSIKVCEYSRSRSFHDDLILQDQASGERSQDQWSSGFKKGLMLSVAVTLDQICDNFRPKFKILDLCCLRVPNIWAIFDATIMKNRS